MRLLPTAVASIALMFALPLAARVAHAQTAAELVAARALFADGIELEKKKDYAGALEKFRRVAAIKSTAIVRYHEGYCAERLGRWIEALDAYARAVIDGQGDPKQKDAVEASRKAADALRPRVPRIHVRVEGTQKGNYELRIDGTPVSAALIDTAVPVDLGKHLVEVSGDRIAADSQEVTVAEKETKEVVFQAKEVTAAPPPKDEAKPGPKEPPRESPKPKPADAAKPEPAARAPKFGIVFGFNIGNISPAGRIVDPSTRTLPAFARDGNSDQAEYFGWGVAIEPLIGVRIVRPIAVYLSWQHGFLTRSGVSNEATDFRGSTDAFALGVMLNTHPNGPFGAYADLALTTRSTFYDHNTYREKATLTGSNLRVKGGVTYKAMPALTLIGFGFLSVGQYSRFEYESATRKDEGNVEPRATHVFMGLGIGATYDLALGKQ